jgi:hypothetical protein
MSVRKGSGSAGPKVIIACEVMQPELEKVRPENGVEIRYLKQGLHRTPDQLRHLIQEQIDQVAEDASRIILGYGLCSNGIVGVKARRQELIVPRAHDCISLFMGSAAAYEKAFRSRPGTYYLSPGWVAVNQDPLGIVEEDYMPRLGRDTAMWVMEEELKHYTHIVLIVNGASDVGPLRERGLENARVLNKQYDEIEASLEYFIKIVNGPYPEEDFIILKPGEEITQDMFFQDL